MIRAVMVYAVDPGPEMSALVVFDGRAVLNHQRVPNAQLLDEIADRTPNADHVLVVEQVAAMGMAVGADVFETCVWSGRFIQAWASSVDCRGAVTAETWRWERVKRHEVKTHLCGSQLAKDPNIRQVLIDRFGPGKERAIGSKAQPGPLYGIAGDEWSALAVAVTWWDRAIAATERRSAYGR